MINYNVIVNNNTNTINTILNIIVSNNNLRDINYLKDNCSNTIIKEYLKELLNSIKALSYELISKKWDIDVHDTLLKQFQNAYIGSELKGLDSDNISTSFNNGFHPNTIENRYLKIMQMKEEQQQRIEEYISLEEKFNESTKAITDFIHLLPQPEYQFIMEATFIKNKSDNQIINECKMLYSDTYIRQARFKSIQCFCQLIRFYLRGVE